MKKVYVSWSDIQRQSQEIIRRMYHDNWKPDYVVGITRGGLVPANLISQYLDVPMHTLGVSLRDTSGMSPESNLWMAEDAFGYVPKEERIDEQCSSETRRKNILIVDDINDSGATLNWIKQDWSSGCLPNDPSWDEIWGSNVRVAVLYDNQVSTSQLDISYAAEEINKHETPQWIVFPWEEWWKRWNPQEEVTGK